jgi:hypothetical protein
MLAKSLLLRESRRQLAESDRESLDWAEAVVTLDGCIREGGDPSVIRMLEEDLATKRAEVGGGVHVCGGLHTRAQGV